MELICSSHNHLLATQYPCCDLVSKLGSHEGILESQIPSVSVHVLRYDTQHSHRWTGPCRTAMWPCGERRGVQSADMSWLCHFPLSFYFPCSWSRDNVRWALKGGHRVEVRDSENPFRGTLPIWFIVCSLFYSSSETLYDEEQLVWCHLFSHLTFQVSKDSPCHFASVFCILCVWGGEWGLV